MRNSVSVLPKRRGSRNCAKMSMCLRSRLLLFREPSIWRWVVCVIWALSKKLRQTVSLFRPMCLNTMMRLSTRQSAVSSAVAVRCSIFTTMLKQFLHVPQKFRRLFPRQKSQSVTAKWKRANSAKFGDRCLNRRLMCLSARQLSKRVSICRMPTPLL